MVKKQKRTRRTNPRQAEMIHLAPEALDLDELEERMETALVPFTQAGIHSRLIPEHVSSEPCGCFSTLCQCDGHDCVAVCDVHCIIDYV